MLLAIKSNREVKISDQQRAEYEAQGFRIVELNGPKVTVKHERAKSAVKAPAKQAAVKSARAGKQ